MSAAEAAALEREAADAGLANFVNFEFRYHPVRRLVRDLVRDGSLGVVEHVSWVHFSAGTRQPLRPYGWLFDRDRGGGWIGAWASHAVDTLRFCFAEVADAVGSTRTVIRERPDRDGVMHECTAEDGLRAALTLRGGTTVAIDSSYAAAANTAPRLTVLGAEATIEVIADEHVVLRRPDGSRHLLADLRSEPAADRHATPMRVFAQVVADCVRSGEMPEDVPTFADGRVCDEVLERLRGVTGSATQRS
jgi:predicted dehydrogenase